MNVPPPFLAAVRFLTRIPLPHQGEALQSRTIGRSLLYYPLVGLLIGLVLATLFWLLGNAPPLVRAALVLTAWVGFTGALHLDGLADTVDAWAGGRGDATRTLALMKDPHCGPMAIVALILVLLLKCACLYTLTRADLVALAFIPALARSTIPLLFATIPYVRPGGLGSALSEAASYRVAIAVFMATVLPTLMLSGAKALWTLFAIAVAYATLRAMMLRRIGGTTGDTAGALVEVGEVAALIALTLAGV